ncbi:hypothetical protein [Deinococcus sp. QL22]|uniref:hypothetical protein n=1 Tax=Deinococcus sp. QL22 TaxID=2939437 RepID=UPI00201794CF|nr:hypothetical protein [Deinococcus sp. QL22]UQN10323.1 hypothetical protein M1R55_29670 [Deinococcus sp. QL22]UQN10457.1 hypothetical protein M1R55_28995 [Deinococcus sp. QL22]
MTRTDEQYALDEALSRWMGYAPDKTDRRAVKTWSMGTKGQDDYASHWPGPLSYSTDRNTCAEAEARIVALGWGEAYTNQMIADGREARQLPDGRTMSYSFYCLTASPEIRCRAILKTIQERRL